MKAGITYISRHMTSLVPKLLRRNLRMRLAHDKHMTSTRQAHSLQVHSGTKEDKLENLAPLSRYVSLFVSCTM